MAEEARVAAAAADVAAVAAAAATAASAAAGGGASSSSAAARAAPTSSLPAAVPVPSAPPPPPPAVLPPPASPAPETPKRVVYGEAEECPICFEDFDDTHKATVLSCGHCFHAKCIREWETAGHSVCPTCMQPTSLTQRVLAGLLS